MMELNQTTLRGILAQITSVDERFIVPKEGRWWNPQDLKNIKPNTWCAYVISSKKPRTYPFFHSESGITDSVFTEKIATIDLQFVGLQAEEIADSVALWPLREDVKKAFAEVRGSVLPDDITAVSSNFYQDGSNTVLAWNVTIRVLYYQSLDTTLGRVKTIELT